jgi:hypothetical protein
MEKTPENLWDRKNEASIKMDINILGGFNFAVLTFAPLEETSHHTKFDN